ncbi:hypothetical protein ACOSQ3_031390 [Xanthoceras sorbifolium]
MGRVFVVELDGRSYRCKFCRTHLALPVDLASRAFHSRRGKAYLFNKAVNISIGALEQRQMLSGVHTVADIFCCCCGQIVGWKYESAHEKSQQYKEGKFVLESFLGCYERSMVFRRHLFKFDDYLIIATKYWLFCGCKKDLSIQLLNHEPNQVILAA